MKILLLGCDRPEMLKQVIKSVKDSGLEIFCLLDMPKNTERLPMFHECKAILRKNNIPFESNGSPMGCSPSTFKLLSMIGENETALILEDDVPLKAGAIQEIVKMEGIDPEKPFVWKLNQYYWGWVTNGKTVQEVDKLRFSSPSKKEKNGDQIRLAIEIFNKEGVPFVWDEFWETALPIMKIPVYQSDQFLTDNIGHASSSRIANEDKKTICHYALFRNGNFQKFDSVKAK